MPDREHQPCPHEGCPQKTLLDEGEAQAVAAALAGAMVVVPCAHGPGWHAVPKPRRPR